MKTDLSRWNRAGLSRLSYVDGDAAVWLEELRLALAGLYARGVDAGLRSPDVWRDAFMKDPSDWPLAADQAAVAAAIPWERLRPARPPEPETRGRRSRRLLEQYAAASGGDQAWEIARAFARAAHVVIGHVDAHAGEGYLRTATQWDNLRRLAAMVNYHPGPPASASTLVALDLVPGADAVEIAKGLAARHTPPTGGLPLVFETLDKLVAHSDLNAARPEGWNRHTGDVSAGATDWLAAGKISVPAGAVGLLDDGRTRQAITVETSNRYGTVLRVTPKPFGSARFNRADVRLWIMPEDVRAGMPRTAAPGGAAPGGVTVLQVETPLQVVHGDIVALLSDDGTVQARAVVIDQTGRRLRLAADPATLPSDLMVRPLQRIAFSPAKGGMWVSTPMTVGEVWFANGDSVTSVPSGAAGLTDTHDLGGGTSRRLFKPAFSTDRGYLDDTSIARVRAQVERPVGPVSGQTPAAGAARLVVFSGKPPKRLAPGSRFVARPTATGTLAVLRVVELSVGTETFTILFDADPPAAPDLTEFHGPLTEALPALHHDRNPDGLGSTAVAVPGLSAAADALLKPGRRVILSRLPFTDLSTSGTWATIPGVDTEAVIADIDRSATVPRIVLTSAVAIAAWPKGDTVLRMNAVGMGHGESKGAILLGSGDAERIEQSFRIDVDEISHIASTASTNGVVPDVDIGVDGTVWPWRDLRDLTADGARAWSGTITEDGRLVVNFRRRLPTGTNNISVVRHRVGTGSRGTGVPPGSLKEPAKKHPQVVALVQPFPTAGGADRESVASMRVTAPAHLAANGRAVSARDFERLAMAQASVWRARAEEVPDGGALRRLQLTLVPAGGAPLTADQVSTLRPILLAHSLPGVRLDLADFRPLRLLLSAEVRTDELSHDKADVKAACEAALLNSFGLRSRDFAQATYAAEVMSVLETVPAVETAIVSRFDWAGDPPAHVSTVDGASAAIFPHVDQVLHLAAVADVAITVRGLS